MRMIPVNSSMLASLGYDADQQVLVAQFPNGSLYRYNGVPIENYVAVMTNAESHGKAFNEFVKNRDFKPEKVDAEAVLGI